MTTPQRAIMPPLEPATFSTTPRAAALLERPVGFRLTGEELLGCGLCPGDLLLVDAGDHSPAPGALVVVQVHSPLDASGALVKQAALIAGQYWPTVDSWGMPMLDIRAVLPGFPTVYRYFDAAYFAEELIGVVHGYYATGKRGGDSYTGIDMSKYDWEGWDFREEMRAARGRMKALGTLFDVD